MIHHLLNNCATLKHMRHSVGLKSRCVTYASVTATVAVEVAIAVTKWPLDAQVISCRITCEGSVVSTSQHVLEIPLS